MTYPAALRWQRSIGRELVINSLRAREDGEGCIYDGGEPWTGSEPSVRGEYGGGRGETAERVNRGQLTLYGGNLQ